MARRGRPRTDSEADEKDINGILAALDANEGWTVKIWRILPDGDDWLANLPVAEVGANCEAMIGRRWGPGKYKVRAWSDNKQLWAAQKTVRISQQAAADCGFEGEPVAYPFPPDMGRQSDDRIMQIMQQSNDRTITMMMETNKLMMGMITAVLGRPQPVFDPAQALSAMASTFATLKGAAAPDKDDSLAKVRELAEIAQLFNGGAPAKETGPMDLLLEGTKALGAMAQAGAGRGLPPGGRVGPGLLPPPEDEGDTRNRVTDSAQVIERQQDSPVITCWGRLMFKAMRGADPVFWADWIVETAQDPTAEGREAGMIAQAVFDAKDFESWSAGIGSAEVPNTQIPGEGPIREWFRVWFDAVRNPGVAEEEGPEDERTERS